MFQGSSLWNDLALHARCTQCVDQIRPKFSQHGLDQCHGDKDRKFNVRFNQPDNSDCFEEGAGVLEVLFGVGFDGGDALKRFVQNADNPLLLGQRGTGTPTFRSLICDRFG